MDENTCITILIKLILKLNSRWVVNFNISQWNFTYFYFYPQTHIFRPIRLLPTLAAVFSLPFFWNMLWMFLFHFQISHLPHVILCQLWAITTNLIFKFYFSAVYVENYKKAFSHLMFSWPKIPFKNLTFKNYASYRGRGGSVVTEFNDFFKFSTRSILEAQKLKWQPKMNKH